MGAPAGDDVRATDDQIDATLRAILGSATEQPREERVARPRAAYSLQRVKAVVWYTRVLG